tara:strand:+ start:87 stop:578 length:492 start_codon:yes stop_codon:yes gene_type:complete
MEGQPITDNIKICDMPENKRILITSINGLLGHSLFELMRNDHVCIEDESKQPHRFLGTVNPNQAAGMTTPVPSETVKIIETAKPKNFVKQVRGADYIVLDVSQFSSSLDEANQVLKALKYSDAAPERDQVLVVVTNPMVWSKTETGVSYDDSQFEKRVPLPKF